MKFKASHTRVMTGNNVEVKIACERNEELKHVRVELDGFALTDEDVPPGSTEYENEFLNAGDAGPLMEHSLLVTATTTDDAAHSSTMNWTDPI